MGLWQPKWKVQETFYSGLVHNMCNRPHCTVILPVRIHSGGFEVENNIALTVTVCIALFKVIGELQRERLHHSLAAAFNWNGETRGQLLQAKS